MWHHNWYALIPPYFENKNSRVLHNCLVQRPVENAPASRELLPLAKCIRPSLFVCGMNLWIGNWYIFRKLREYFLTMYVLSGEFLRFAMASSSVRFTNALYAYRAIRVDVLWTWCKQIIDKQKMIFLGGRHPENNIWGEINLFCG